MSSDMSGFSGLETGGGGPGLPFVSIKHQVRKEGQIPGTFNFSDEVTPPSKTLNIIVVGTYPTRAMWAQGATSGRPICRSNDGLRGSMYGLCADCQYSKFEEKKPPQCQRSLKVICLMPVKVEGKTALEPILWDCSGITISEVSKFIQDIAAKGMKPFEYGIPVGLQSEQGKSGIRYKCVFPEAESLQKLPDNVIEAVLVQRDILLAKLLSTVTPQAEETSSTYEPPQEGPAEPFKDLG